VKRLRIRFSEAAITDIIEQSDWYRQRSGNALSARWDREIDSVIQRILRNPETGAHCSFPSVELVGLRRTSVEGFPKHLIFYRIGDNEIFVLRVLHGARDLEGLF
jgi:toxin ParE1/3/4